MTTQTTCDRCGEVNPADIHTCTPPAQPAPVQDLPFGVGAGLVAIKTLLSRDPCAHANTAIEMIDAILNSHPAAQPALKPLTDEYLETMAEQYVTNCYFDTLKFARAIEAAHGIKENT